MVRMLEPFMSISLSYLSSTNFAAHMQKCCLGNILLMILVTGMGVMQANWCNCIMESCRLMLSKPFNLKIEPVSLVIVSEVARQPQVGHQMKWWASLYTNMLTQSNGTRRKDSTGAVMTLSSKRGPTCDAMLS